MCGGSGGGGGSCGGGGDGRVPLGAMAAGTPGRAAAMTMSPKQKPTKHEHARLSCHLRSGLSRLTLRTASRPRSAARPTTRRAMPPDRSDGIRVKGSELMSSITAQVPINWSSAAGRMSCLVGISQGKLSGLFSDRLCDVMLRTLLLCVALAFSTAFVLPSAVPLARAQPLQQQAVTMIALTKPQRTNNRRREYNKMYKSEMKTAIKRVRCGMGRGPLAPLPADAGRRGARGRLGWPANSQRWMPACRRCRTAAAVTDWILLRGRAAGV